MSIDREYSIVSQVAAKAATDIAVAQINNGVPFDIVSWLTNQEAINEAILNSAGSTAAAAAVVQAFPSAQVVAQPAPQAVTAPAPAGNSLGINPNQLSTAKDDKAIEFDLVNDLLANPRNWYDNRQSKPNPKGPDFKRKADGKALWLRAA